MPEYRRNRVAGVNPRAWTGADDGAFGRGERQ